MKPRRATQIELQLRMWGGARQGAGRKRSTDRASVSHVARPRIHAWSPLIITMRVRADVPDLRQRTTWAAIVRLMRAFRARSHDMQVVHYAVLRNHLHLIGEAGDKTGLTQGMLALSTRLAKGVNATTGRTGPLFEGRYHARELSTPTEVRNALRYVLLNARHHAADAGITLPPGWLDRRSTAAIFDGWRAPPLLSQRLADFGTAPARSWLLREGWRRHGLLEIDDIPGGVVRKAAAAEQARAA